MRKAVMVLAAVTVCAVLAGCGVAYQQNAAKISETAKPEDYGPPPPDNYQEDIQSFLEEVLIDPGSTRYSSWEEPYRGTFPAEFASTKPILGWRVKTNINAKNRMGGYTGTQRYIFFYVNSKIYAYCSTPLTVDTCFPNYVHDMRK